MSYREIANSKVLLALCAFVIVVVLIQSILFVRLAWKRGKELQMDPQVMKRTVTNSVILSIVPSLPIIIMMYALAVPLGNYFPWLRLSIVGSAVYEGMAANIAAQSQGLVDISDPGLTPEFYVVVMFVMTIGIIGGILFNIFFMKRLDSWTKKMKAEGSSSGFMSIFTTALFSGMLMTLSVPYVANVKRVSSIVTFCASGVAVTLCNHLAKKYNWRTLSDFSLPIALIAGMAMATFYVRVFG